MTKRAPRIYVGQFGAFWSCSLRDGVAFLKEGFAGNEYDLDADERFKRIGKPTGISKDRDTGSYSGRFNYLDHPCDWDKEEWEYHLEVVTGEYYEFLR